MYFSPLFNFGTLKRGPFTSLPTGFLSSDFFQNQLFLKILSGIIFRVSNCLQCMDPDQDRLYAGPDLCAN